MGELLLAIGIIWTLTLIYILVKQQVEEYRDYREIKRNSRKYGS